MTVNELWHADQLDSILYDVVGGSAIKFNERILVTATDAARKVGTSVGMQDKVV